MRMAVSRLSKAAHMPIVVSASQADNEGSLDSPPGPATWSADAPPVAAPARPVNPLDEFYRQ